MIGKIALTMFMIAVASFLVLSSWMPGFGVSNRGVFEIGPTMAYGSISYEGNQTYDLSLNDVYLVSYTNQIQVVIICPHASIVSVKTDGSYTLQNGELVIQYFNQIPCAEVTLNSTSVPTPTVSMQMFIAQGSLGLVGVDLS
ncbi:MULTISPECIES: hypothetical protein [Metallosphaera]|uniref:Uncharacterized protein n=3 Tax=Metallosphaera TaxID=41980 RepID=A4YG68_METS5|nr:MULTISPECIES: hypothetical protein [Metallosphaera]ABP95420.1 hypothetical protein Msed_1260 [Metallosphaera sedula DSM 5348]AIM27405.1 hypothetical protein HA72_1260 [Metallosphaera sedula]AKV74280.1 hypothetical protein MsedA_1279 [Metallosphaera sedula]AKV76519.1 hypothetical protein MsedB_1281 [Metallosphaera sedula]AKV78771.1 hypothetical protein MsedC_1279 [Metallosphaera sedula]